MIYDERTSNVDKPIESIELDALDRDRTVETLARLLVKTNMGLKARSTERVIGLTGAWGSGKSSVLNLLAKHLESYEDVFTIRFNPWLITGSSDLIEIYFKELTHQLGRSSAEKARELASRIDEYRESISRIADFVMPGASMLTGSIPKIKDKTIQEKKDVLEEKLRKFDGAIVVLIDELDRVDDADIRELARFVKAIGDLPNISYLVGYDHVRVQKALASGAPASEGEEYLKKVVQVNIPLRPMLDSEVERILLSDIDQEFLTELQNHREEWDEARKIIFRIIDTPRALKRYLSTIEAYWIGVGREVHPVDLALFSIIAASSSDLRSFLVENMQTFVDNPTAVEGDLVRALTSREEGDVLEKLEFDQRRFGQFEPVIRKLFPRVGGREWGSEFGRISQFDNFIRLLYFGDPPFRLSRAEAEALWEGASFEALLELQRDNKLEQLPQRMEELFEQLPQLGDFQLFSAISVLVHHGGPGERARLRKFCDEIRWSLSRICHNQPSSTARVLELLGFLLRTEDYCVLPDIVRHHMFAFGLAEGFAQRDYPTIWSSTEFPEILEMEVSRYVAAIRSGDWVQKFVNSDPFYAALQAPKYASSFKEELSSQLESAEAALAFSVLVAPPNTRIEKGSVSELVDIRPLKRGLASASTSNPIEQRSMRVLKDALELEKGR